MATPIYITSLMELLKSVGWEQQEVAARLGVSKTAMSLWSTGARPISRRYEDAFLELVGEVLRMELARPDVQPARVDELKAYLNRWDQEMYIKVGRWRATLQEALQTLQQCDAARDPLSLSREDITRLQHAARTVIRQLMYLESVGHPAPWDGMEIDDPFALFWVLRDRYRATRYDKED